MSESATDESVSPAKRWLFRLLAVLLSLLACLLLLEIGLRIGGPRYYRFTNGGREYYSNPRGYFDIVRREGRQPIYGIVLRRVDMPPGAFPDIIQSQEMLQRFEKTSALTLIPESMQEEIEQSQQRQMKRLWPTVRVPGYIKRPEMLSAFLSRKNTVLGVGDSFTVGQGVRYEDTYLRRLEKRLAEDGASFPVKNAADLGYNLEEIRQFYTMESEKQRYPLVIYGFVLNDFGLSGAGAADGLDYIDFNNGGNEYSPWRRYSATLNFVARSIEAIQLDRVTKRLYLEAFQGDNAREHFQLLADFNGQIQADGGQLVIVLFPLLYEFDDYPFQGIHKKIDRFCREQEIPLLDLLPAFTQHRAEELWVHPIDHHPNEIAHQIAAEELYAFLNRRGLLAALEDGQAADSGEKN